MPVLEKWLATNSRRWSAIMDGERSIPLRGRPLEFLPGNLRRCATIVALGLLAAASLLVMARRLAGALANPLEPATLLATGLLVATVAAAIRLGWLLPPTAHSALRLDRTVMILTSLALAALGLGLCLPDTPAVGRFLFCTLLAAEESGAWAWYIWRCFAVTPPKAQPAIRLDSAHAMPPRAGRSGTTSHTVLSHDSDAAVVPEDVTQQLTRSQATDGTEELSGWLRTAFAAGQRTRSIHVAFCPAFAATPELEVEQVDGPETRIKTAQLLPYGVRLDLKLAVAAEEPAAVLLQFSARTVQPEK
jgi:hypothetical protein